VSNLISLYAVFGSDYPPVPFIPLVMSLSTKFIPSLVRSASKKTAPKSLSVSARRSYASKKLTGSKTHQNLKDAFAGESMVRMTLINRFTVTKRL
jgi:hypothetical protein